MKTLQQLLSAEAIAVADQEWEKRYRDSSPIQYDEARFRPMVDQFYRAISLDPPAQIAFFISPMAAAVALDLEQESGGPLPTMEDVAPIMAKWGAHYPRYDTAIRYLHDVVYTPADAAFTAYYDALDAAGHQDEVPESARQMIPLSRECGYLILYSDLAIICDRPSALHLDDGGRFHAVDTPALQFRDGWSRGYVGGIPVPRELVIPEQRATWLTAERILHEANAEERRIMMDIFTPDRFIAELGAKPIDASDFGTLYRVEFPAGPNGEEPDEPLCMVRLLNSTDEYKEYEQLDSAHWLDAGGARHNELPAWIDGQHMPEGWRYMPATMKGIGEPFRKTYWLRVPPTMERARQAVAWTFGMDEQEYQPAVES